MPTTRKRTATQYPQSEGRAALADERLGVFQQSIAEIRSPVAGVAQGISEEHPAGDAASRVKGSIAVVGVALLSWCLIVLVMYWIRSHL